MIRRLKRYVFFYRLHRAFGNGVLESLFKCLKRRRVYLYPSLRKFSTITPSRARRRA